jgi:hypothetical protein
MGLSLGMKTDEKGNPLMPPAQPPAPPAPPAKGQDWEDATS